MTEKHFILKKDYIMDFKDVLKLLNEYVEAKKVLRHDIKLWLHEKQYFGYSVKIDNDVIRLEGTGEVINGKDIHDFMKRYNVVLIYKSRNHIISNDKKRSIWGEGEYYNNQYIFR